MGIENDDVNDKQLEQEPSFEDALNDAIGPASDSPEPAEAEIKEEADTGDEGGTPDDDAASGADEADAGGEDEAAAEDKDGKPETDKPGDTADKPDEDKGEVSDDDIEAGLKDRSRQRFQELRSQANAGNEWQRIITQIGATPDQLAESLEIRRLANAGDAKGALKLLDQQRAAFARAAGEEVPGVDFLAEHADLKERVESGELERPDAVDIANARRTQREASQQREQHTQQTQQAEQLRARQQTAVTRLDALGAQLAAKDADFDDRFKLMQKEVIPWMSENLPPEQWEAAFMHHYNLLGQRPAVKRDKPTRPLSGSGQGASGAKPEPKSMDEAVAFALGGGE